VSFDVHVSFTDTERWKEDDVLIQTDDLGIQRYSFTIGYLWSTWNRAIPPAHLEEPSRLFRFGVGGAGFYRRQAFERSDFIDETAVPPTIDSSSVHEDFDIAGGEVVLDFEIGPRNIIAGFLRGRSGIEYVGVRNDGLGLPTEDTHIDTYGVHGQVEAGVVSQPFPNVELRLGYRWIRQDVFREKKSLYAVDPDLGPVIISIELPDNTTEMHMAYFEAAFPF
jgi:hypothetical protein